MAVGNYGETRVMFVIAGTNKDTLFVSFQGIKDQEDWKTNFAFASLSLSIDLITLSFYNGAKELT